jgi:hypothetical protein
LVGLVRRQRNGVHARQTGSSAFNQTLGTLVMGVFTLVAVPIKYLDVFYDGSSPRVYGDNLS